MQTSAPPLLTDTPLPCSAVSKLEVAARLIKNGNAAMSREDKAAFGIDTWNAGSDTPEELNITPRVNDIQMIPESLGDTAMTTPTLTDLRENAERMFKACAELRLRDTRCGRDSDVLFARCHTLADLGLIDHARVQQLDAQVIALIKAHYGAPHA